MGFSPTYLQENTTTHNLYILFSALQR